MTNFEKACEMSFNDWAAAIPDIVPEAEYTAKHEKWLKTLFNKMRNNRYHTLTSRKLKLLLTAAVIATLLLTAFAIPSSREYIISRTSIDGEYKLTKGNHNEVPYLTVGYIPEGYELVIDDRLSTSIFYEYRNSEDDSIQIHKESSNAHVFFDNDNVQSREINIDGIVYLINTKDSGCTNIIWNKNDYIYVVSCWLPEEEYLKIVKSIK